MWYTYYIYHRGSRCEFHTWTWYTCPNVTYAKHIPQKWFKLCIFSMDDLPSLQTWVYLSAQPRQAILSCIETNRKIAFVMKLYTWNIPEISHFLKYHHDDDSLQPEYMSWIMIFHLYDIQPEIPDAGPQIRRCNLKILGKPHPRLPTTLCSPTLNLCYQEFVKVRNMDKLERQHQHCFLSHQQTGNYLGSDS